MTGALSRAELERQAQARAELEWRRARADLGRWIELATPFGRPKHLARLLDLFDRIERGERVYAMVAAPPRHAKTSVVLAGAVRRLKNDPSRRVLYTSHIAEIALEKSREARDIALVAGLHIGREIDYVGRADPSRSVRFWQTSEGGAFMALGRGGRPIGRGFHLMLVDDPFGSMEDAENPNMREAVWNWFTGTLFSRVEAGGSMIVAHQRWHHDDLIGRIRTDEQQKQIPWELVELPAINDRDEALWPEVWPLEELRLKQSGVGPYVWAANYQQRPVRKGAQLFADAARWGAPPYNAKGARLLLAADPAASAATSANRWAIGLGAFRGFGDELVLDIVRVWAFRAEVPEGAAFASLLQRLFGCRLMAEGGGPQKAVPQTLRRLERKLQVDEVRPVKDKFSKWQPTVGAWGRGAIRVPSELIANDPLDTRVRAAIAASGRPELVELLAACPENWLSDYLGEMGRVSGVKDKADDCADMTSTLWDAGERAFGGQSKGDGASTTSLDGGGF